MPKPLRIILTAALAGALLLACGEEDIIDPPIPPIVNDTPANCLRVIAFAWSEKDFERFKPCLAPDFVFYFNPNDVGQQVGEYTIPASWNAAEMKAAVRHMLDTAYGVDMTIPTSTVGLPEGGATTWEAKNLAPAMIVLTQPGTGYRVGAGYCDFEFERYEENGAYRWRLTSWWDHTREGRLAASVPGIAPSSLGRILSLFY